MTFVSTGVADLSVLNVPVAKYASATMLGSNPLLASGAARYTLNDLAVQGGNLMNEPGFLQDRSADDADDGTEHDSTAMATYNGISPVTRRIKVKSVNGAVEAALGTLNATTGVDFTSPEFDAALARSGVPRNAVLDEVGKQLGPYWGLKMHVSGLNCLKGTFGAGGIFSAPPYTIDRHASDATNVKQLFNRNAISAAKSNTGTRGGAYTVIIAHSKQIADLENDDNSGFQSFFMQDFTTGAMYLDPVSKQPIQMSRYKQFVLFPYGDNDGWPVQGTAPTGTNPDYRGYYAFMLAPGAIRFGIQRGINVQAGWNYKSGAAIMFSRLAWAVSVAGTKFVGTPANLETGVTPAELVDVTKWAAVFSGADIDLVGARAIVTNVSNTGA